MQLTANIWDSRLTGRSTRTGERDDSSCGDGITQQRRRACPASAARDPPGQALGASPFGPANTWFHAPATSGGRPPQLLQMLALTFRHKCAVVVLEGRRLLDRHPTLTRHGQAV